MIIPFEELNRYDFVISDINIIFQRPSYRHIPLGARLINGFLYITNGYGTYILESGERIDLFPGCVIYLPKGGRRIFDIDRAGIEFYRVDFNIYIEGEIVLFSDKPILLLEGVDYKFKDCINNLLEECRYEGNEFLKKAWLLMAFSSLLPHPSSVYNARIGPAVKYIDEHFNEKIDCHKLAKLCYLSTSQFYSLFNQKFGKTPIEYRDSLILRRAELLLESGETSVAEIAEELGFASASYFCRFFKKHRKVSPSNYH